MDINKENELEMETIQPSLTNTPAHCEDKKQKSIPPLTCDSNANQVDKKAQSKKDPDIEFDEIFEVNNKNPDKTLLYVIDLGWLEISPLARQSRKSVLIMKTIEWKVLYFVIKSFNEGASEKCTDEKMQTPLHRAVIRGFKGVVDILLEKNANLVECEDKDGNLPFHLVFKEREEENSSVEQNDQTDGKNKKDIKPVYSESKDDILAVLIKHMPHKLVRGLFLCKDDQPANYTLQKLLEGKMKKSALAVLDCLIDSLGIDSGISSVYYNVLEADVEGRTPDDQKFKRDTPSCIHLISMGGYKDIAHHDVVRLLIRRKWLNFGQSTIFVGSLLYFLTLFFLTFSVVVAVDHHDPTIYDGPLDYTRCVFESWTLIYVSLTLTFEIYQLKKEKMDYWKDLFNLVELSSSVLLILVLPLRSINYQGHWKVFAAGYLLWTLQVFKYATIFRPTSAYAQTLWRLVSHDFLQFTALFLVILLAFSGTFVLSLKGDKSLNIHSETSSFWKILLIGVRILTEGQPVVEYTGENGFKLMSSIIMIVFLFVCCVVLLNILIAQLSDTYQNVQKDVHKGLELNRAWIIARTEPSFKLFGTEYRKSKYVKVERIININETLKRWESPSLANIEKNGDEHKSILENIENQMDRIKDDLSKESTTIQNIEDRLSKQEAALSGIQEQLRTLIDQNQQRSEYSLSTIEKVQHCLNLRSTKL